MNLTFATATDIQKVQKRQDRLMDDLQQQHVRAPWELPVRNIFYHRAERLRGEN